MRNIKIAWLVGVLFVTAACGVQVVTPIQNPILSQTAPQSATSSPSPSATPSPTATLPPTYTPSPLPTSSLTPSPSPSITPTSTSEFPQAVVIERRAFCRYGPGKAYLYSHELNQGDRLEVEGRNHSKTWLWVKPQDLERHCWAAASVLEVTGDIDRVHVVTTRLPQSSLYGPPDDVEAERDGDEVTISWDKVWMTVDDFRGYLIEATVCQGGGLVFVAVQTDETSVSLTDEGGCAGSSEGRLYSVEKHGYTDPIDIPWP